MGEGSVNKMGRNNIRVRKTQLRDAQVMARLRKMVLEKTWCSVYTEEKKHPD